MVYIIKIHVDGGCRANGQPDSIAGAAAAFKNESGKYHGETKEALPSSPRPTNQQAEIISIILGLEKALERYDQLTSNPWLDVTIYSDSRYAVDCMTKWVYKWSNNGWTNSEGNKVANRDLIMEAVDLDDRLKEKGDVHYVWIPREENQYVDKLCNDLMDDMCMCGDRQSSSSDSSW
ncbi:ribonuclease H1 [Aspergillus californicus]